MATVGEKRARLAQKKVEKLKDAKAYWTYLENLKLEGKPHCMIDQYMKQKKQDKEAQEKLGCCPCMFSAYQRYKKNLDVK